jgi:hypothetical protein
MPAADVTLLRPLQGLQETDAWAGAVILLTMVKYSATSGGFTAPKGKNSIAKTSSPYTIRPHPVA